MCFPKICVCVSTPFSRLVCALLFHLPVPSEFSSVPLDIPCRGELWAESFCGFSEPRLVHLHSALCVPVSPVLSAPASCSVLLILMVASPLLKFRWILMYWKVGKDHFHSITKRSLLWAEQSLTSSVILSFIVCLLWGSGPLLSTLPAFTLYL